MQLIFPKQVYLYYILAYSKDFVTTGHMSYRQGVLVGSSFMISDGTGHRIDFSTGHLQYLAKFNTETHHMITKCSKNARC